MIISLFHLKTRRFMSARQSHWYAVVGAVEWLVEITVLVCTAG